MPLWRRLRLHFLLFALLVLPGATGSLSAYLALLGVALFLPEIMNGQSRRAIAAQPAFRLYGGAMALLLVTFAVTAESWRDLLYIFNFAIVLLAAVVFAGATRFAGRGGTLLLAGYALAGAAVAAAAGLYDVTIGGLERAGGLVSNPIHYADVAVTLGWLALIGLFAGPAPWRLVFLLGPVLGLAAAMMADVRGALIAFPPLAVAALVIGGRAVLTRRQVGIVALLLAAVCAAVLALQPGRVDTIARAGAAALGLGGNVDGSTGLRLGMWSAGWQAFLESPIVGHGWDDLFRAAQAHMSEPLLAATRQFTHLHSDLADFAVGAGLLGVAAYLLVVLAPVAGAYSQRDDLSVARLYGAVTLTLGYMIFGLTNMMFGFELQTNLFGIGAALVLGLCRDAPFSAASRPAGGADPSGRP